MGEHPSSRRDLADLAKDIANKYSRNALLVFIFGSMNYKHESAQQIVQQDGLEVEVGLDQGKSWATAGLPALLAFCPGNLQ